MTLQGTQLWRRGHSFVACLQAMACATRSFPPSPHCRLAGRHMSPKLRPVHPSRRTKGFLRCGIQADSSMMQESKQCQARHAPRRISYPRTSRAPWIDKESTLAFESLKSRAAERHEGLSVSHARPAFWEGITNWCVCPEMRTSTSICRATALKASCSPVGTLKCP